MLQPANPKYQPIVLSGAGSRDCSIIGTVIGVIRAYR
jgi:SOS-response transcriptional repressor LexA